MTDKQTSQLPSPQTTLVILLGASEWPHDSVEFRAHRAFDEAAEQIYRYFVQTFGIPYDHVLQLFNTNLDANAIDEEIYDHLERFKGQARDVIVYYVGHGQRTNSGQLYLAIRNTRKHNREGTSLQIAALAKTVLAQARTMRRFYILDCCFAARAIQNLQGITTADLLSGTIEEIERETHGYTGLFSSGISEPSVILPDDTNTFFTEAFLRVLSAGNVDSDRPLSFYDVYTVINATAYNLHRAYIPTHPQGQRPPEVRIYPGDVAEVPILPRIHNVHHEPLVKRGDGESPFTPGTEIPVTGVRGITLKQTQEIQLSRPSPGRFPLPSPAAAVSAFPVLRRPWFLALILIVLVLVVSLNVLHPWAVAPKRGTTLVTYLGHSNIVDAVAWSPDGQQIATASADGTAQLWDAKTGNTLKMYRLGNGSYTMTWLPAGLLIAFKSSINNPNTIQVLEPGASQAHPIWTFNPTAEQATYGLGLSQMVWSPDGKYLAFVSIGLARTTALSVLDVAKKTLLFSQPVTNGFTLIANIAWSPDSTRIAYNNGGILRVINATTDHPYQDIAEGVDSLAWSPDGAYLAASTSYKPDNSSDLIRIYSIKTQKAIYTYNIHTAYIASIAWSPDGKHIASADVGTTYHDHAWVWDALTGGDPYIYDSPGLISDLAWSPDSTRIASVGIGDAIGTAAAVVWQAV